MKKTQKIITILMLISILTMSLFISTVNAAVTIASGAENSTVTITRNVNGVTNPVTNTFTYTIAFDSAYGAAAKSGTATNFPTSATVVFNNKAPVSGTATQTGTVDFAGTTFNKVGDYRFTLKETATEDFTKYPLDGAKTYYLYVSVRFAEDDTDGTKMVATVATQGIKDDTKDENATPTPGKKEAVVFESEATFTYITISKQVTGNMGDKSEYFDVTVTIPGTTGDTYLVSGGKYGTPATSETTVTAGTAKTLQIKHNETLTIGIASDGTKKQIPVGTNYTVAETAVEGYETTIDNLTKGTLTTTKTAAAIPTNNQLPATNKVSIVNHYEVATLTGVFFNIMPYVVIAAAVIILIAMVRRSSKNKKED